MQRAPYFIHSANFHHALSLAKSLGMDGHIVALTQALAVFARNSQDAKGAARLFESLAVHYSRLNDELGLASCYHQLGRIAQEQRDFAHGEQWYLRSLAIKEAQGDEHGIANTYAQLGTLERMQQHWVNAAQWYVKAVIAFNNGDDTDSMFRVANIYIVLLQQSDTSDQDEIRELWQQTGLEQLVGSLDKLIEESNEAKKSYH